MRPELWLGLIVKIILRRGQYRAEDAGDWGPASVPVEDAIAWGQVNASTVVVLVCDDAGGGAYFSAGEVPPERDEMGALLQWPEEGGLLAARRLACHATSGCPPRTLSLPAECGRRAQRVRVHPDRSRRLCEPLGERRFAARLPSQGPG